MKNMIILYDTMYTVKIFGTNEIIWCLQDRFYTCLYVPVKFIIEKSGMEPWIEGNNIKFSSTKRTQVVVLIWKLITMA